VFVAGKLAAGGHHDHPVDLADASPDQNLRHTTDYRRAYASVIRGWQRAAAARTLRAVQAARVRHRRRRLNRVGRRACATCARTSADPGLYTNEGELAVGCGAVRDRVTK